MEHIQSALNLFLLKTKKSSASLGQKKVSNKNSNQQTLYFQKTQHAQRMTLSPHLKINNAIHKYKVFQPQLFLSFPIKREYFV